MMMPAELPDAREVYPRRQPRPAPGMTSKLPSTALLIPALALAVSLPAAAAQQGPRRREALDVEKLRVVPVATQPNRILTCDVLVVGGGVGGVAAAEAAAQAGLTVILTEPTSRLGGQFTSQGVTCPDENSHIERNPGTGTAAYRRLRDDLRAYYAARPGIRPGRAQNVGQCWVSRLSGEPAAWEAVIRARLAPLSGPGGIRKILLRHEPVQVRRFDATGRCHYTDLVDLDSRKITRVAARYLLDASEMGDVLPLAAAEHSLGAEGRDAYGEPSAPEQPRPDWIQSLTYCFAVRWLPDAPEARVPRPREYDAFKALGEYTLRYDYSDERGQIYYKVFERAPGAGGPFWTYRRILAASSFDPTAGVVADLALINWRGNDFHDETPLGKEPAEQVRILRRARDFSLGFLYWLQTECPRDDGRGLGYPEMKLAMDVFGGEDGLAPHPYIREARRLVGLTMLRQQDMLPDPARPERRWGTEFPDSVGTALYAIDIHPARGEPPLLSRALPYEIPLGSFIARDGPDNLLPAAKNFGATRLALASARMHPTEWLVGEVAGTLAAYCLTRDLTPASVRAHAERLREFQEVLTARGVTLRWSRILTEG